jgi:hypothetical protein
VQRLVIARMQRKEYADRLAVAADVVEQAPGTAEGARVGEAEKELAAA